MAKSKKAKLPKLTPPLPSTNIRVIADTETDITRERDPEDKWDANDTASSTTIHGIEISGKDNYYDITVPFEVEDQHIYHLVYVNYDTGDSFSHHTGQVTYVDMFKSAKLAKELVNKIADNNIPFNDPKNWDNNRRIMYTRDVGPDVECYTGTWKGYFERYNYAESVPVQLTQRYRR